MVSFGWMLEQVGELLIQVVNDGLWHPVLLAVDDVVNIFVKLPAKELNFVELKLVLLRLVLEITLKFLIGLVTAWQSY